MSRRLSPALTGFIFPVVVTLIMIGYDAGLAQEPVSGPIHSERAPGLPPGCGFIPPRMDLSHLTGEAALEKSAKIDLPIRWDWREHGVVTPVRDQGACGACYAFAAIANFESKMLMDGEGIYDFSENNAKECHWQQASCSGGNYYKLANFFATNGTVLESCDPYVAINVSCKSDCPYIKTLLDWRIISGGVVPDPTVIKNYLYQKGPLKISFYAGDNDAWYSEFTSYDGSYTLYRPDDDPTNHAVLLVGWDDTLSHAGGTGAWIVKNSWGTDWGGTCGYGTEKGYFTIAYGSAGICKWSSYLNEWQNYSQYQPLKYYDEAGWNYNWGYGTTTAWGMCKFIPDADASLVRVEFWTNDVTSDVDIYVYNSFDGTNLSNLLRSSLNHAYSEAGYHSVALSSPVAISTGNDIYVAIRYVNASYTYPVPADANGPTTTATCYISDDGSGWHDLGASQGDDVGIRIRVQTGTCIDSDSDGYGDPGHPENDCPDDNCPNVFNPDQTDGDADGVGDDCDNCPDDANPGQEDSDGDLVGDACDACPGFDDSYDGDSDTYPDSCDNCPNIFNPDQTDDDIDGVGNDCDNCPDDHNPGQEDSDGDLVGDACDACPGFADSDDCDGDAHPDSCDNCPSVFNHLQEDADEDGIGDSCDVCIHDSEDDSDEDGICGDVDNCPTVENPDQEDDDDDSIGNVCDPCTDIDDDGFGNPGYPANTCDDDNCPDIPNPGQDDRDDDNIGDVCDNCPDVPNPGQEDTDGDDIGDLCDYVCGDANGDEQINIADAVYLVNYVFKGGPPPDPMEAGDANCDTDCNIADAVYIINYVFKGGPEPCCP